VDQEMTDESQKQLKTEQIDTSSKGQSRYEDHIKKEEIQQHRDDKQVLAQSLNEISIVSPVKRG
jgi:hypothetical protein